MPLNRNQYLSAGTEGAKNPLISGRFRVGSYAERLARTDAACVQKLELVRGFLTFAFKQHWCRENLSVSVRIVKKIKSKTTTTKKKIIKRASYMTQQLSTE